MKIEPQATVAAFDGQHPEGADYVIVPAMSRDDDPAVLRWLRSQAGKGAVIIGVCAGAKVVGAAGLLDGRRAITHWWFVDHLRSGRGELARGSAAAADRGSAPGTGARRSAAGDRRALRSAPADYVAMQLEYPRSPVARY